MSSPRGDSEYHLPPVWEATPALVKWSFEREAASAHYMVMACPT